jgi:hypothetical protein
VELTENQRQLDAEFDSEFDVQGDRDATYDAEGNYDPEGQYDADGNWLAGEAERKCDPEGQFYDADGNWLAGEGKIRLCRWKLEGGLEWYSPPIKLKSKSPDYDDPEMIIGLDGTAKLRGFGAIGENVVDDPRGDSYLRSLGERDGAGSWDAANQGGGRRPRGKSNSKKNGAMMVGRQADGKNRLSHSKKNGAMMVGRQADGERSEVSTACSFHHHNSIK